MKDWQSVPIPAGLDARPKDARGFPITFVTLIESDGRPDFTVIAGDKIVRCIREALCGMCGLGWPAPGQLGPEDHLMAFIGGPLSVQYQNFLDPPMHVECARYAMQVCPHIATPTARYAKPKEGEGRELYQGIHPDRPEKFALYVTGGYEVALQGGQPVLLAEDPIRVIWQDELEEAP